MSSAILQLQEGGKLHMLKEKWWKQRKGGGKCKVSRVSLLAAEEWKVVGLYERGVELVAAIGR